MRKVCSCNGVASWLIWRARLATTICGPAGRLNRHSPRTTNASPENRPAESFGIADASRFIHTTSDAESAGEMDSVESMAIGDTTPPMKPTFHGRGGGAALNV